MSELALRKLGTVSFVGKHFLGKRIPHFPCSFCQGWKTIFHLIFPEVKIIFPFVKKACDIFFSTPLHPFFLSLTHHVISTSISFFSVTCLAKK